MKLLTIIIYIFVKDVFSEDLDIYHFKNTSNVCKYNLEVINKICFSFFLNKSTYLKPCIDVHHSEKMIMIMYNSMEKNLINPMDISVKLSCKKECITNDL